MSKKNIGDALKKAAKSTKKAAQSANESANQNSNESQGSNGVRITRPTKYFKSPKTYGEGATEKIRYAAERTADAAEQRNRQIQDEYRKYKSRRQGRGNRGKPVSPVTTETTPYTKSRAYTSDEYEGVSGKIRHAVAETSFIGDTVGSGENVSEEYKRWKRGEFPKTKVYKL